MVEKMSIADYVDQYEFRGDYDYKPTLDEQAMILDALYGYIAMLEEDQ